MQGCCKGDSGGPLMRQDWEAKQWIQIAIVQGQIGECGNEDYPGIYVRLNHPSVLSFIHSAIGQGLLDL